MASSLAEWDALPAWVHEDCRALMATEAKEQRRQEHAEDSRRRRA